MFGINRRLVAVIFGVLALAFIVGSVLLFTPQGQQQVQGRTEFTVNGIRVSETDIARGQQQDPILSTNPTGLLLNLARTNFGERQVILTAVRNDTSRVRVSGAELRKQLDEIKQQYQLNDDEAYNRFLSSVGYTDSQLRDELRDQIRINKKLEELQESAKPTEEEIKFHFDLNKTNYKQEERVQARQIVVDDKATADKLAAEIKGGADFAETAKKNSKLNAEQGGALGEVKDGNPGPVTKVVFPNAVADAVFKLAEGGVTAPIEAGGRFYIVKVEKKLSAGDAALEDADIRKRVEEDVKRIKGQGAIEAYVERLRNSAKVEFPEGSQFKFENPVVAKVGETQIKLGELTSAVFANQQIPQLLQQGLGELAVQFFMPQTMEQLVTREAVHQAALKLGQPFFGSKTDIANQAQQWQTRNVAVSDAEVRAYYDKNLAQFTVPASAKVQGISFTKENKAKADAFRAAALRGGDLQALAKAQGGTVQDYGAVNPNALPPVLNRLVFLTRTQFPKSSLGEISEVVKLEDGTFQVLIVNERKAEQLRPFAEVRDQAREAELNTKRQAEATKWSEKVRKEAKVENNLDKVLKTLTPKEEPKTPATPGSATPATPTTPANPATPTTPAPNNP